MSHVYSDRFQRFARVAIVGTHSLFWISGSVLYAQTEQGGRLPSQSTSEDGIFISLPVFVSSVLATAVFAWTIAKYDSQRVRRLDRIERQNEELLQRLASLEITKKRNGNGNSESILES